MGVPADGHHVAQKKEGSMTDPEVTFTPTLQFLSNENRTELYHAALQVLEETGMQLLHEEALSLLAAAGCDVSDNHIVKMPRHLVTKANASAPANISIYDRDGHLAMDLGDHRAYFGTGSDLIYALEPGTAQRHHCRLEDIQDAARVGDALANIDFIMSFAHPNEVKPDRAYLVSFWAMASHSIKPIVTTAQGREDLQEIWEVSKLLRGGEGELRAKPYWIHYAEPISPLKHPVDSVDKLLFCARTGMPVIYSPAPIAGSTAPMSIAGHVVQGLAESLFGLVIHQLAAPGAPFIMGMGPAVLDMTTGQCSYNAPEYLMAYMAIVEMHHYLNLPNWGYAGTSDSQIADQQATFEAGLLTFMSAMAGSNLNHDVGYLDFGRTGSLEMIVVLNEIIDQVRRMLKGVPITADTLALNVIQEGAREGQFLTHPHTLQHLRATQWRPELISRMGYEKWVERDGLDLMQRANLKLKKILETHHCAEVSKDLVNQIEARIAAYKE
jgi:trimethylamine--corrinoid protein Co-methyltransferase